MRQLAILKILLHNFGKAGDVLRVVVNLHPFPMFMRRNTIEPLQHLEIFNVNSAIGKMDV